jgi:hypothetical protein
MEYLQRRVRRDIPLRQTMRLVGKIKTPCRNALRVVLCDSYGEHMTDVLNHVHSLSTVDFFRQRKRIVPGVTEQPAKFT